ncbi:hypothetical protein [Lactiplantibacillus modestisalitolerans]|uniref:Uncharacterized protein n=1 Tax=Lactiplantibacillus modestisalitolerans TaxID=1457219 RepID=A0ABV5WWF4_9LACO|nr:hypothetical protein [Lactiplantibacillus modestisalitolerans]
MQKLMPIAVTDIATNIARQPAFMTIVLNQHKYSTARKKTPFILKALNEGAAAHGRLTIAPNRLTLADEYGVTFQTLLPVPTAITGVRLGLYRAKVHQLGPGARHHAHYRLMLTLATPSATYRLLNTDLSVIPALVAWAQEFSLALEDPLNLAAQTWDWRQLTVPQFEQLTRGTAYFAWNQTIGAPLGTAQRV